VEAHPQFIIVTTRGTLKQETRFQHSKNYVSPEKADRPIGSDEQPPRTGSGNMTFQDDNSLMDASRSPQAYLLPYPAASLSKPIPVASNRVTIGRSPHNAIIVASNTVSRRHAVMISRDDHYFIKDMDSRNGTYINDEKVAISRVEHRDRITFGDQTFLFLKTMGNQADPATDIVSDATHTLVLSPVASDPGDFLACSAENARFELFAQYADDTLLENRPLHFDHKQLSLLDKIRGRGWTPADDENLAADLQQVSTLKRAHHRLTLLYRLSERLRATSDTKEMLEEGLSLLLEAISAAERALIMLRSRKDDALEVVASKHRNAEMEETDIQISRTLLDWVIKEKMALMTQNASSDLRLKDSESIQASHLNAIICVPIIITGKVIGIVYVDSERLFEPVNQEDVAFTAAVAHELALSIVNVKLQNSIIRNERMAAIGLTISNLAHNIKNLTMMNQGAIDLMRLHLERIDDEKADKCWQMIEKSFTRINTLTVEMLDYASERKLSPASTDINRTISAFSDLLTQSIENKGITLHLDLSVDNPHLLIDGKQFQRALLNLFINAVDAVADRADGEIRISTAVEDARWLVVAVKDNGCGIPPDKQTKIFDLFFTTKGTKGSGLGLPMVNKFIDSSGGKLLLNSEKDIGTTFKMVFPLKK
jgi:two-component system NtrC family sensor kinase